MQTLYFVLVAIHLVAIVATGLMWTVIDLRPQTPLRRHLRDIRAVHFGSLYLVPIFLGLAYAFERLQVPPWEQLIFPVGLGLLLVFSSIGYLFPIPPDLDPFYYWTRGKALFFALTGLACLIVALLWTAGILVWYALF